jgi:hypothetical protein
LRGEAGDRQHPGARTGLAHMVGVGAVCVVHVLSRDPMASEAQQRHLHPRMPAPSTSVQTCAGRHSRPGAISRPSGPDHAGDTPR